MNTDELKQILNKAGIAEEDYLIGGGYDGRWCMSQNDDGYWEVYTFDRGVKGKLQEFSNEEAACYYMLGRLARKYILSRRLVPPQR